MCAVKMVLKNEVPVYALSAIKLPEPPKILS